jgi:type VII secretion protein EccB
VGSDVPVGSIVRTVDSRGEQLYVVLRDGLQPISAATADIIRYGDQDTGRAATRDIAPAVVAGAPIVHQLPVDHYPAASPQIVPPGPNPVACMGWQRANASARASVRLIVGQKLPVPAGAETVRLATADGNGPGLDSVYLTPGTGEYIQATGAEPESQSTGPLFYVSDTGLRYHIKDLPTADSLGAVGVKAPGQQSSRPQLAPWPVLALLPPGPELSQEAALVAHDGVAPDPNSVAVPKS